MSLVDNRTWYVLANFRENSVGSIRLGMSVEVYLLSFPTSASTAACRVWDWAFYQGNGARVAGLTQVEEIRNWCGSHNVSRCESYWKAAMPLSPSVWEQPRS